VAGRAIPEEPENHRHAGVVVRAADDGFDLCLRFPFFRPCYFLSGRGLLRLGHTFGYNLQLRRRHLKCKRERTKIHLRPDATKNIMEIRIQ